MNMILNKAKLLCICKSFIEKDFEQIFVVLCYFNAHNNPTILPLINKQINPLKSHCCWPYQRSMSQDLNQAVQFQLRIIS